MRRTKWLLPFVVTSLAFAAQAQNQREAIDPAGVARLAADSGGTAQISIHSATGAARFVSAGRGGTLGVRVFGRSLSDTAKKTRTTQFLNNYSTLFGITSVTTELAEPRVVRDATGATHLNYKQVYRGLPVFGAELKAHFNPAGELNVVNGTFIPGIDVDPTPTRSAVEAAATATMAVNEELGRASAKGLSTKATLMIFREGLAQGVDGASHLAWQVEVGNKADVREFVYVNAHTGKIIDRITGIHDAKNRRAFNAAGATAPGPNYPNTPFWVEGQAFPTGTVEADNMIAASSDVYDFFKNTFGRDSYDGAGARMDSIYNRGNGCPNASWGGQFISFCPGLTTDDVTAHEWGHAYTEYTHGLIYQWQPGALNEAYSDIWGETVDRINGRGGDTPDAARNVGVCTVSTPNRNVLNIMAPGALAGPKLGGSASFGVQTFSLPGQVVAVDDGVGAATDGCQTPFVNAAALVGKIAYMDRSSSCTFVVQAKNAQLAGAIGVVIGNNVVSNTPPSLTGTDATVTIPALSLTLVDGTAVKTQLASNTVVAGTMTRGGNGTDNSVRWLLGEDSTAPGLTGALRDMYNPTCYGNPGRVTDAQYACSTADSGGVHGNSGVPNHGYALTVDGGTFNGQTITGIGLTKAAHIYWRAQTVYQGPSSGFADHADAVLQSCNDLRGANLNGLTGGTPSGQVITDADCAQVAKVALAVEFKTPPSQCNFAPLLGQTPPSACTTGTQTIIASDGFDGGKSGGLRWLLSNASNQTLGGYIPRDWGVVKGLPGGRAGVAIFASDDNGGTCGAAGDQSSVMRLESPEITIPANGPTRLMFDHYIATEVGYDGGNVKISVNGGPFVLVSAANFVYNAYNRTLATAAGGNTNPLAGQAAFSGTDGGSVGGSWGRSIVNLGSLAGTGDKIKLRFESGKDGCGGVSGWYLDDIKVYSCQP